MEAVVQRKKLAMSDGEIESSFRTAADKNKQIGILADLNACKPQDILDILMRMGAITGVLTKDEKVRRMQLASRKSVNKVSWTPDMKTELLRLREVEKLDFTQIADRLGVTKGSAQQQHYKLRGKKGAPKETGPEEALPAIAIKEAPTPTPLAEDAGRVDRQTATNALMPMTMTLMGRQHLYEIDQFSNTVLITQIMDYDHLTPGDLVVLIQELQELLGLMK